MDVVKDDPDDNKFIATALALKAGFIVTGDKHLLSLKEYKGIKIVKPNEFLMILLNDA
ncbi:MAG: putative toxin-antitoxin system toxin component, PIN family [Thermodesulfovibrionales bacterium]